MSFLNYQDKNPEFLNNFLKYTAYITFNSNFTVDEMYVDIRTFFRYLIFSNMSDVQEFNIDEFRKLNIKNISLEDLQNVSSSTVEKYIYFLKYSLSNSAKTRNRKLSSLRKLFSYLDNQNMISYNPLRNISNAKVEKRNPKYLSLTESKKLLSNTIKAENKNKIRNYAITCIFLNCCIRLSELVGINLNDVKLDERTLKVHGKGNIDRIIYLDDAVIEAIKKYLSIRPNLDKSFKDNNSLFLSSRNKRISRRSVQNIIKQEVNNTFDNGSKLYHTHSLRHTGATLMYDENNTDILIIKEILGHQSLCSTEIYTHVTNKRLKELMQNFNILGGIKNDK